MKKLCRYFIMSTKFQRYSLFPIKYPKIYNLYKKQRDNYWVPAEVDLETDVREWRHTLTDADRHFLTYTLSFFAQADGIVLQNVSKFDMDCDIPEVNLFYGIQAGIEAIHWEMYGLLIDALVTNPEDREKAHHAIENYPCIAKKAEWLSQWMTDAQVYPARLIAFACAEGIFFSSAFASIFYYKKKGLMPGLCMSNKFIARDEGLHRDAGIEIFLLLREEGNTVPDKQVYEIVSSAVDIESNFVEDSLNVELIGINKESMKQYIKYTADHLLVSLHLEKLYNVDNPFDWMDMISMTQKQNFFEGRVSEYKKNQSKKIFNAEEDF